MVKPLGKLTLSAGIARINVGPEETPFDVHVELLCDNSPYFNNVYKDRTDSAICDIPISLPDVDPDVFAKTISWMYRGQLSADLYDVTKLVSLFELWVLAEKLEIPALQDETITACKCRVDSSPPNASVSTRTIEYVYANTKPGSPPRRLLVDIWVWRWPWQKFSCRKADLPREFLEDLCEVIFARVNVNLSWVQSPLPKLAKEYYVGWTPPAPDPIRFPAPASPPSQDSNALQVPTRAQMAMREIKSPSSQLVSPLGRLRVSPRQMVLLLWRWTGRWQTARLQLPTRIRGKREVVRRRAYEVNGHVRLAYEENFYVEHRL